MRGNNWFRWCRTQRGRATIVTWSGLVYQSHTRATWMRCRRPPTVRSRTANLQLVDRLAHRWNWTLAAAVTSWRRELASTRRRLAQRCRRPRHSDAPAQQRLGRRGTTMTNIQDQIPTVSAPLYLNPSHANSRRPDLPKRSRQLQFRTIKIVTVHWCRRWRRLRNRIYPPTTLAWTMKPTS